MLERLPIVIIVTLVMPAFAQYAPPNKPVASNGAVAAAKGLTVDDVIMMTGAGISEDVIITKLRKASKGLDLGTDELVRLQKAKVSANVMRVLMDPKAEIAPVALGPVAIGANGPGVVSGIRSGGTSGATPAPGTEAKGDSNDPMTPHDSGIYLVTKDRDGKPKMLVLERAAYQGAKSGGLITSGLTYGLIKAKTKALIPGAHASIRVSDATPVFYFYFDDKQAALGKTYFGVSNLSNPNQFALVKLEVKGKNRESTVGEFSSLGTSSGVDSKAMMPFRSERIRPGLYKVTVEGLGTGEYCFIATSNVGMATPYSAGMTMTTDIFDFGVEIE